MLYIYIGCDPNPFPDVMSKTSWELTYHLEKELKSFRGITKEASRNPAAWKVYALAENPETSVIPGVYQSSLSAFDRLLMLKCFSPAKLIFAISAYVGAAMGSEYVESLQISMVCIYTLILRYDYLRYMYDLDDNPDNPCVYRTMSTLIVITSPLSSLSSLPELTLAAS